MKKNVHKNSIRSYAELPTDSVLKVALEILRQQQGGGRPTANTIGRGLGIASSSVTGRLNDILKPEDQKGGGGYVKVGNVMYRLHELPSVKDAVTGKPNAVWVLIPFTTESAAITSGVQAQLF